MKKENILVLVLICIASGILFLYGYSDQNKPPVADRVSGPENPGSTEKGSGIEWNTYAAGIALARTLNRPVFLYFHADWCVYCKKMEETTFRDEKVQATLRDHFVSIAVDTEKEQKLAADWDIRGLPMVWFTNPDGMKISRLPGYVDGEYFQTALKFIHTGKYATMDFSDFNQRVRQGLEP